MMSAAPSGEVDGEDSRTDAPAAPVVRGPGPAGDEG